MDLELIRHNLLVRLSKDIEYLEKLCLKASLESKRELALAVDTLRKARGIVSGIGR